MSKLTRNLLIGAVSAIVAAILVVASGSPEGDTAALSEQPAKSVKLAAIDTSLERLERRIDEMTADSPGPEAQPVAAVHLQDGQQAARLHRLERRIAELEQQPVAEDQEPDRPEPKRLTREELVERTLNDWYQRLQNHDDQERDPAWAPETSAALEQDLLVLARAGRFDFLNTDCKSTTCTASVEFENYDDALTRYASLLHHDYQVNCAREVLLPEPEDVQTRYLATVLYDCSAGRAALD